MKRSILWTLTAVITTACAAPQQPATGPGGGDWGSGDAGWGSDDRDWGLNAYIIPPEQGGLRFHVNRPAYVAMFEIVPNGGTRLIYPAPGAGRMDGFVFSGTRVPDTGRYWRGGYGEGMYTGDAYSSAARLDRPRFLFLVASERPLDIDAFGSFGAGLRATLGHHYYASIDPYATMERIAEIALPSLADDGTWATDMYVYWPRVLRQYRASRDVLIRCNGFTMYVEYEYAYEARSALCGNRYRERDRIAQRPRPTTPRQPADSTELEQPGRRAPLPPAEDVGQRRVISSRQLEQPRTQRPEERRAEGERATAEPADETPERPERGRAARPGQAAERPSPGESAGPEQPVDSPERGRPERPDQPRQSPQGRAQPEPPRPVRPAPTPRVARPVQPDPPQPPRERVGAPVSGAMETPRPRATSNDPIPTASRPTPSAPAPASPAPASPPRQSAPRAQPSPAPAPQRETGAEAPRKRRGGGGGGVDGNVTW